MGIRTHCPKGHSLHVKANLAGKRGICPECGARFLIPSESEIAPKGKNASTPSPHIAEGTLSEAYPEEPIPTAIPIVAATHTVRTAEPLDSAAPASVWYVRTREGKQYGPADDATMGQWVIAGRVPMNARVWRSGWSEWQTASDVVDQLPGPQPQTPTPPPTEAAPIPSQASAVEPAHAEASTLRQRSRLRSQKLITLLLVVLVVVLTAVLTWILLREETWQEPSGNRGGTPTSMKAIVQNRAVSMPIHSEHVPQLVIGTAIA